MKLYAITKGEGKDYHICALTTISSRADELEIAYSDCDSKAYVEVFEDDVDAPVMVMYHISSKDGSVRPVDSRDVIEHLTYNPRTGIYNLYVRGHNQQHALSRAIAMVAEYKKELSSNGEGE